MTLRCKTRLLGTPQLVAMARCGHVVPCGEPGGPAWSTGQRCELFDSLERRWPVGALLAWNPSGDWWQRWYLLDGHRRVDALGELVAERLGVVRDLGRPEPTYLPGSAAVTGGMYLPVNAMLAMRLLPVMFSMSDDALAVADRAAGAVVHTLFEVTTALGGIPDEVAAMCNRLLPGRVQAATLAQVPAQDNAAPYRPRS